MSEKRAPVQGNYHADRKPSGTISWSEHLQAWEVYNKKCRCNQSAERIAERCGFAWSELCDLLGHEPKTWQENQTKSAKTP